jgi:hypothetical protein
MIKLKNGFEIPFNKDFDVFFQDLLEAMVRESRKSVAPEEHRPGGPPRNELFLKELMDNCIYVTHQLFIIAKDREEFSRFIVTGFIFNSIITALPMLEGGAHSGDSQEGEGNIH